MLPDGYYLLRFAARLWISIINSNIFPILCVNTIAMSEFLTLIIGLGIWLFLQLYLFPKFGVST